MAYRAALSLLVTVGNSSTAIGATPSLSFSRIDIDAIPLSQAIVLLGEQAGVTIGLANPQLGASRVRPYHGKATPERALEAMLRNGPAVARSVGDRAFRIEQRPTSQTRVAARPLFETTSAIVVTGSKRGTMLSAYPGSAIVTDVSTIPFAARNHGSEALVSELPVLSSTHLGSGRNKLFIRGIADSSFNGPSQGTVGQYLGDARLTYNAPDPDLALYDIAETEILEGPQGTLYGAGTLGGIIRLDPVMPNLDRFDFGLSLGGSATQHGAPGFDTAGLINLPIKAGTIALRALAYASNDGGYINDPGRKLSDINLTQTRGGRVELRWKPSSDWTIDMIGVIQDINARDGDYAERSLPSLERDSVLNQPFENNYSLGNLVVKHEIGHAELTSSATVVHHTVNFNYDATQTNSSPRLFREDDHIMLITNETRLARRYADGTSWVVGVEALRSSDEIRRSLGTPPQPPPISGSRNTVIEAALFGEATVAITPRLSATAGGRLAFNRLVGNVLDRPEDVAEPDRHSVVFLPSIGTLWRIAPGFALFARYQEGFRPGGLSVSDTLVERYRGDGLSTGEVGARFGQTGSRLQASAAVSFARWKHIQADLVDASGLPMTTNVGNGRVLGLEGSIRWHPIQSVMLAGGLFLNDSTLDEPAPAFEGERDASLPNVDDLGFHVRGDWTMPLDRANSLTLYGALRYVSGSKLGVGTAFDFPQGHYVASSAGLRWNHKKFTVSVDVSNLLDDGRNQFALGNPFQLEGGNQITPLRPRTVRLGVSTGF